MFRDKLKELIGKKEEQQEGNDKKKIENLFPVSWSFERIGGKTELAQFLRLKEANIHKTENTIDCLYKKYGLDIFKSAINNEQSKFVKVKVKQ